MRIGLIGTGNMGTILTEAFAESLSISCENIIITNRTISKAERIKQHYPTIHVRPSAHEVIAEADYIFLCVKPLEIHPLLREINPELLQNKCFISITSPVHTDELEQLINCPVVRAVPSITNRSLSGTTLVTFGQLCNEQQKKDVLYMLQEISTPVQIDNNVIRIASDLASCGPAFFSYLAQSYVDAAVENTEITKEQATMLTSNMLIGLGKLLEKQIYTLPSLEEKVCVKGGVTGKGIEVLEKYALQMFEELVAVTHEKYEIDRDEVTQQFHSRTQ
ncbi:late competence protein ComER [Bacillus solimangrovi]|uniref:Pyrroline-5-carboxylate reductase n=1 Tax=Bacillus solimangrovi TaxID=1305675 RepID=A0A1E5LHY6_9BACI|nr:late competence protein ComER [Bacillus solimangrovi]OEH93678.1 late competence protein ComER [Bacillus solimangrovi]